MESPVRQDHSITHIQTESSFKMGGVLNQILGHIQNPVSLVADRNQFGAVRSHPKNGLKAIEHHASIFFSILNLGPFLIHDRHKISTIARDAH
jgi:hypothetical protein